MGSNALISDGGTVSAAGYTFAANQGLNVSSELASILDYSILIDFSFSSLSGFRKIVDFGDRSVDTGLYNFSQSLDFFGGPSGGSIFTADTPARMLLTRNSGTNTVAGYVNGALQFSFTDTTPIATFTGTNGIMRFFEDDNATGQKEASGGVATRISIYDGALNVDQAALLGGPSLPSDGLPPGVLEPSSFVLLGGGLAAVGFAVRRR